MKQSKSGQFSYDLENMSYAEEQQFWVEFETMLQRSRDSGAFMSNTDVEESYTPVIFSSNVILH
ncbi:hypothetical protein [Tolumonas lignilytica]|jgi:hypothetical protein|uniref:hypothetical protein n=1 Tax=Tolumonas lignilytica TaxID=1283284 RepID=UPI0004637127|nr:hypothetical protein [Tolumonas lignilytica]